MRRRIHLILRKVNPERWSSHHLPPKVSHIICLSITRDDSTSDPSTENSSQLPRITLNQPIQWAQAKLDYSFYLTSAHELASRLVKHSRLMPTREQSYNVPPPSKNAYIPPRPAENIPQPSEQPSNEFPGPSTRPQSYEAMHLDERGTSQPLPTHHIQGPYSENSERAVPIDKDRAPINDPPSGGPLIHEDGVLDADIEFEQDMMVPYPPGKNGRAMTEMAKWRGQMSRRLMLKPYKTLDGFDMKQGSDTIIHLLKRNYKGESCWAEVSGPSRDVMWDGVAMRCSWDSLDYPNVVKT